MGLAKMPRHVLDLKKMVILHINLHLGHLLMHFLLWVKKNWQFWLAQTWLFYIAKKLLDPKTQPQNTHRNQNEPTATIPSTSFDLSPWQHLPRTQILAPPIPIGQGQARGVGFSLSAIGSLVWVAKKRPIKKQRDGQGLGLRWPRIDNDNQQSTNSWQKW